MPIEVDVGQDGDVTVIVVSRLQHRPVITAHLDDAIEVAIDLADLTTVCGCRIRESDASSLNLEWLLGASARDLLARGYGVAELLADRAARTIVGRLALVEALTHPRFLGGTPEGLWFAEQVVLLDQLAELGLVPGAHVQRLARASVAPLVRRAPSAGDRGRAAEAVRAVGRHVPAGTTDATWLDTVTADLPDESTIGLWAELSRRSVEAAPQQVPDTAGEFEEAFLGGEIPLTDEREWSVLWPLQDGLDYRSRPMRMTSRALTREVLEVSVVLQSGTRPGGPVCARVVSHQGDVRAIGSMFRSDEGLEGTVFLARPLAAGDRVEISAQPYSPALSGVEFERALVVERTLVSYRDGSRRAEPDRLGHESVVRFLADALTSGRYQASSE